METKELTQKEIEKSERIKARLQGAGIGLIIGAVLTLWVLKLANKI